MAFGEKIHIERTVERERKKGQGTYQQIPSFHSDFYTYTQLTRDEVESSFSHQSFQKV